MPGSASSHSFTSTMNWPTSGRISCPPLCMPQYLRETSALPFLIGHLMRHQKSKWYNSTSLRVFFFWPSPYVSYQHAAFTRLTMQRVRITPLVLIPMELRESVSSSTILASSSTYLRHVSPAHGLDFANKRTLPICTSVSQLAFP